MFSAAVKDIAEAARVIREERNVRRAFEDAQLALSRQTIDAIERAERAGEANWKATQHQIETWRKVDDAKNAEQDDRIAVLEQRMSELKTELLALVTKATEDAATKIDALERQVQELRANAIRPQTPAAT